MTRRSVHAAPKIHRKRIEESRKTAFISAQDPVWSGWSAMALSIAFVARKCSNRILLCVEIPCAAHVLRTREC